MVYVDQYSMRSRWKRFLKTWIYCLLFWRWETPPPKKNTAYTALKTKSRNFYDLFVCFFGFIVPLENCSLIWRRHHYRWRGTNFDISLAVMPIEQWGFFRVSHLLWYVASIYNDNDHLRGPLTLTLIAERSAVGLSLLFLRTWVCDGWDSNIQPFACEANALTYCAPAAVKLLLNLMMQLS